jgi:MYXO-CTERM domain-containing protein
MKLTHVLASILLLTSVSLAQQPTPPNDRTANPDHTYTLPVETGHNWGGWGLLGLFGLAGLLGRRRGTTTITGTGTGYTRDERTYGQQQRRVG